MRIEIEIPKEFEGHFEQDRFEDSLHRLCADAHLIAGNYEKETAIMLIKAFKESKPAYDVEKVVDYTHDIICNILEKVLEPLPDGSEYTEEAYRLLYLNTRISDAIRNGGKE
jgi:hypothetical protein